MAKGECRLLVRYGNYLIGKLFQRQRNIPDVRNEWIFANGYYVKTPVYDTNKILNMDMSIYSIYPYKAGG